jgi:hypothetical protein
MPGRVEFSAAAEATMTESPIAVTCRPDTFGSRAVAAWQADAGGGSLAPGDAEGPAADGLRLAGGLRLAAGLLAGGLMVVVA